MNLGPLLPLPNHWQISLLPKGAQTAVHRAIVQLPVAIAIQVPIARAGIEDPDPGFSRAGPVPDHRQFAGGPKGPQTGVHRAVVQLPVAVEVQVPLARAGAEDAA